YVAGHLLYQRDGTLLAQPFDEKTGRLTGEAGPIADDVDRTTANGRAAFSASQTGVLADRHSVAGTDVLAWFDAKGQKHGPVGSIGDNQYPRLSPDGQRVVFFRFDKGQGYNLWQIDLARNVPSRFAFHPEPDFFPLTWSPDSRFVVFPSSRRIPGVFDLYRRAADGASDDELLYASPRLKFPTSISPDGTILLFQENGGPETGWDTWGLPLSGERGSVPESRKKFPVVQTPFNDGVATFSPDGRWIVYASRDSGEWQVVAQPYPPTGA